MADDNRIDPRDALSGLREDDVLFDLDDEPGGSDDDVPGGPDDDVVFDLDEVHIDLDDDGSGAPDEIHIDLDDEPVARQDAVRPVAGPSGPPPLPKMALHADPGGPRAARPVPSAPSSHPDDDEDPAGQADPRWSRALVAGLAVGVVLGFVLGYMVAPAPEPTRAVATAPAPERVPAPAAPPAAPAPEAAAEKPEAKEVELRLPPALHGEVTGGPGREVRVTAETISLEGMAALTAKEGQWPGLSGTPPRLSALREALGEADGHLLGHADASYGVVAPALFSLAAPVGPVALATRLPDAPDAAPYRLLRVTPVSGEEAPAEAPEVEVEFRILKSKAAGGYSSAAATVAAQVEAAREDIVGCVRTHAPEGAAGKLKLTLRYDAGGVRLESQVRKDTFGGKEPMPCIVGVFEAMELGETSGRAGSVRLALHLVARPGAAPEKPPEPIAITLGPDKVTVSPSGLERFEVPAPAGSTPHLDVAKLLEELSADLPPRAPVRVQPHPDVPWGDVVRLVDALRRPVEGEPLFADVRLLPATE